MSVRIAKQKEISERRSSLRECYICATALPTGGDWRKKVVNEHVIPKALLGEPPPNPVDRWAVQLYVHSGCEETHKRDRDQLMKLLQSHTHVPAEDWNKADAARFVREFKLEEHKASTGESLPALSGNMDCVHAAALWTRGMHAALYGRVLRKKVKFVGQGPVPMWQEGKGSPEAYSDMRRRVLEYVRRALNADQFDELRAWGGALVYQCTWITRPSTRNWLCAWVLEFPGTRDWAMEVTGIDTPWDGCFEVDEPPEGASVQAAGS